MGAHECLWALRSTQQHSWVWWNGDMSSHKCSAHHDIMLMSAYECSRCQGAILMSVHGYLGLLSSVNGYSWLFMRADKHSWLMYGTNYQPWALMIMVPLCHEHYWAALSIHEHSWAWHFGTLSAHKHSWALLMVGWALLRTHGTISPYSWVLLSAPECWCTFISAHEC